MFESVLMVFIACASITTMVITKLYFSHKEKMEEIRANARQDHLNKKQEDYFVDLRDEELHPN
ncbi:MAG TPA: hypothetical protein PLL17_01930 [Defluviitaleaceae bacterium]|jgi:hypothetical protein|nr:hypothetical protein [Candidatus Epulonipiscium sp.]HOQ16027.1 hypothetical protein [Defluviitaleaceae bacterium]HPT76130.1 hypothetical protein [Defluviitaleaceae bacterium]HQD49878.1 hypothetical protein [Defluviitaleaceae bacterium]